MKITILYDNDVFLLHKNLVSDWGFSCLIEKDEKRLLFDTGAKPEILLGNMKILHVDPNSIDTIVISHEHWDHNGGMDVFENAINDIVVYRPHQNVINPAKHVAVTSSILTITKDIYSTGLLKNRIDEQSLILKGKKGWYVLAGCAHPGVDTIVTTSKQVGNVVGIIGGLHGFKDFSILEDIDFVCPCHCTKYKQKLKKLFPTKYVKGGVGKVIEL